MIDKGVKLERMANEIATFFKSYPEAEAIAGVHDHIRSFWAPVMRRDLQAHAHAHPEGLDPLVVAALQVLAAGKSPAGRGTAGPAEVGEIGASDAG